ncbi:M48 family metallopeptidase [Ichthyobacterium seriolicida]|uniref:Peptidase M48 n=1 Tax=Ichthyobacterium seriolicida TaxID=242600 RepID=A0A1J1EBK3_9FLAO|nr:M48 family metallopeptidase [Ichthyobacterium seriolicida]BAV94888.1 peptidase M48 [Ichthyobacterium seriolicida]
MAFSKKVGFNISNIFVIDGSKRSTKANAYFTGFGSRKRIVLYDTLIKKLDSDEIVAVLAHEIGHYKNRHTVYNMIIFGLTSCIILYVFSLVIDNPLLSELLNVSQPSFHIGIIIFSILYSPLSMITNFIINYLSRIFEYQADNFAKEKLGENTLISSLKKLSRDSLSNLTPHPLYVFLHYSHPTLLERVKNLKKETLRK